MTADVPLSLPVRVALLGAGWSLALAMIAAFALLRDRSEAPDGQ